MIDFFNKYPYTDFHELNLDWVIKKVKQLTEDWAATLTEWNNTKEEWNQLYDYVHNYFNNLDVQQEINNKINDMILDGTFATIATPLINTAVSNMIAGAVSSQIDDAVAGQIADAVSSQVAPYIPDAVSDWLNANVDPVGSAVTVDGTLSIPGSAGDAKKTGETVASAYDNTAFYDIDDLVLYNGIVYRCITAITSAESWTAAHWKATNLSYMININEKNNDQIETILGSELEDTLDNGTWNAYGVREASANRLSSIELIAVKSGMVIKYQSSSYYDFLFKIYRTRYHVADAMIFQSSWITGTGYEQTYNIEYDGFLAITFRKHNNDPVSSSDFSGYAIIADSFKYIAEKTLTTINGFVTPEMFYEASDNGDYTRAIRKAVSLAGTSGVLVFQPNKTYTISATITIPYENFTMMSFSSTPHMPVIKCADSFTGIYMFACIHAGITFENLTIEGNYITKGIQFYRSTELTEAKADIDGKVIWCNLRHQHTGINVIGRNCKIQNTGFSNCKIGVIFNYTSYNDNPQFMRGWIVDNCRFHSMGTEWYNEGLPEYEDTTSVSQFEGWCVLTPGGNEGYRVFGIYVTNNIVDGFGYCGLYMGNTEQLCMKNNVISRDNYNFILCFGVGGTTAYMGIVSENVVYSNVYEYNQPDETIGNMTPIYLTYNSHLHVCNNSLYDFAGVGVRANDANKAVITNNMFDGIAYYRTDYAVFFQAGSNNVLANNYFRRKLSSAIQTDLVNNTARFAIDESKYNIVSSINNNLE